MATLERRFWSKVNKHPDGCWLWTGSTFRTGRGQFRVGPKNRQAHRVAWELTFGSPPPGLLRSACGNLRCVRPDHLVVGVKAGTPRSLARPDEVRFWEKVDKAPDCWVWMGSVSHTGVGQFRFRGRMSQVHRVAWQLIGGELAPGEMLRHGCGNLRCVRPDHMVVADSLAGAPHSYARTEALRFWEKVQKGPSCWLWTGGVGKEGGGRFIVGGKVRMAPRVAWRLVYGEEPPRSHLHHRCGNPRCVRPEHLAVPEHRAQALRGPGEAVRLPTPRQLDILRAWLRSDMRRSSRQRIAVDLGLRRQTVTNQLWELRKRMGVASTPEAVEWLDEHQSHWRGPIAGQ